MFWNKDIQETISPLMDKIKSRQSLPFKLVATALLGLIAAIFQSSGGWIPGIGMLISPFSSAPIILSMLIGPSFGLLCYLLTIFLLLLLQPSELIVFPFTTGIMAIGLGFSFLLVNRIWKAVILSAVFLLLGICFLLYGVRFPILGPFLIEFSMWNILIIYLFSLGYCWFWTELVLRVLPRFLDQLKA
ncbi:hypothetical protein [Bacillus sp. MRMR6]|uniref:hypothetical protein n=1 Tax=Bacillus sp. MRMR6 TaxID=1928617 RepID=UPI0009517428|nr:hypothetical protein [Bacillus sp. MRMR6]OLS39245.1 hypothetical protein BTR25_12615 [Bacillus sp. MRMR6]